MEKILLVEDEHGIASFVRLELLHEGYQVQVAEDGRQGLELFQEGQWDLILLDIMLPGINGLEVLRRIRKLSSVPVILLTARGDTLDKVSGLDAGADDYLSKPFAIEELLARIRSLLRRKNAWERKTVPATTTATQDEGLLFFRNITLNPKSREVSLDGQLLSLTKTEYQLLFCLMSHKNEALSRENIMDMVWGQQHYIDPNSVDVYVRYLRNKLDVTGKESCITTLRGIGYIMKEPS
ncbi:MAG: response regulator transcription factor [Spirochaetaceae bacterium]|nr:response regulator transcription factor [Spirochaetaceae bacterium]